MSSELSIAVKIGAVVGGAVGAIRSVLRGTRDVTSKVSLLQREYDVLGRVIRRTTQSGSADLARLEKQQAQIGNSLRRMTRTQMGQQSIQTRLDAGLEYRKKMREEVAGAVAGLGTVLIPIKAAMSFESSMADVRKVVDFETPQQFKEMEQQLLSMTHKIPMAATELAKIAASGGQLGIARQDIAGFTETIAKMSVAFDMSAEQAGDSMAKLANVYKIPIKQIGELGDAINHLSNSSPAKASDIVNTLGRVGGVAKQFGLTELQTASLANAFISLGKTPEVAGTAINGMLTKLSTADRQGKKFQTALKSMGISAQKLKANIAKNGEQALMDFLKQVNKLPQKDQMGTLVDLFGLEYADDVAVLTGSLETYQKSIDALKASGKDSKPAFLGSMDKEFAARSATTANNLQLFKSQLSHLAVSIGSVMLPAVNDLLNSLKPMVEHFIQFAQAHPELIKNVFLALAGLVAFKAGGLAVRFMLSGLGSAFWKSSSIISGFFSLWSRGAAAFRLFQIGRAISALRMFGLTARQAKLFISGFSRIGSGVASSLRSMSSAFLQTLPLIRAFVQGLIGGVLTAFKLIGTALFRLGAMLLTNPVFLALGLLAIAVYLLYTRWTDIVGGAKLLWQDLCIFIGGVASQIAALFSNAWTSVQTLFNTAINAILQRIQTFNPVTAFQAAFAAVAGFFSGLANTFMSYGGMLIAGLVNGIKAKIGAAVGAVQGLAARIKGAFTSPKSMDIHSPSRVFRGYGGYITEGLALGVNSGSAQPLNRIGQLAGSLKERFAGRMRGFNSDLSARLSANADTLTQARSTAVAQSTANANSAITIHFNPTINAQGGNPQQIETALQMGLREFEDLFNRMIADHQRRKY